MEQQSFHEVDGNNLFSYGTFTPENLTAEITGDVNTRSDALLIKGWCMKSNHFPDKSIKLRLYCQKTRFGMAIDPVHHDGRYHINVSVPLKKVGDTVECTFEIYDEENDLLQISKQFNIHIEDEMRQNFPSVDWRDFTEEHRSIRQCYWFIHVPEDNHPIIVFNEGKNNFKAAIEDPDFHPQFREEFIRHFRQAYTNALLLDIETLSDELLDENLTSETPYRSNLSSKLIEIDPEDNLWNRYALLNQELTGIRQVFDEMLKGVTTFNV